MLDTIKKIIFALLLIVFLTPLAVHAQDNGQSNQESASGRGEGYNPEYNVLPIVLALFIFYLITYLLFDTKFIKRRTYKQIWSLVVVGSFLFSGFSGIILSFLSDYKLTLPLDFNLLFWHVEFGVILAIASILHIHIYWKTIKKNFHVKF